MGKHNVEKILLGILLLEGIYCFVSNVITNIQLWVKVLFLLTASTYLKIMIYFIIIYDRNKSVSVFHSFIYELLPSLDFCGKHFYPGGILLALSNIFCKARYIGSFNKFWYWLKLCNFFFKQLDGLFLLSSCI